MLIIEIWYHSTVSNVLMARLTVEVGSVNLNSCTHNLLLTVYKMYPPPPEIFSSNLHETEYETVGHSKNILVPDYQSNDIENCLDLSLICQIRFSNLPGFNRSFLPVEMGDFLQKAPFENLQKRAKTESKTSLCSPS